MNERNSYLDSIKLEIHFSLKKLPVCSDFYYYKIMNHRHREEGILIAYAGGVNK